MGLPRWLEQSLLKSVDKVMGALPQKTPSIEQLRSCRLIAHRGAHSGTGFCENTLHAFDRAVDAGASGLEFDIRWTKDGEPVVFHDENCMRVFGIPTVIVNSTAAELRNLHPQIPTFAEVVERYGKRTHLMIELKRLPLTEPVTETVIERACRLTNLQIDKLRQTLKNLTPGVDYHLMSLQTGLLEQAAQEGLAPKNALLSIAELNVETMSDKTLKEGWAGFTGQYLLTSAVKIRKHQSAGQVIGTGFADSKNVLFREINRGVDWVFTNRAPEMAQIIRETIAAHQTR